jgi:hypothetical protein
VEDQLGPCRAAAEPRARGSPVEAYYGPLGATREVGRGQSVPLRLEASLDGGVHRYGGTIPCARSGMQGYSVRVRPSHPEACGLLGAGLITWWGG